MRQSRVSLCMIVRDEAATLDACLTAAKSYVDEICVVDTGSVDDTVAIARRHGAKVKEITWPDDFAEARNHSLEMATGDWILVLDADEVLRAGHMEAFDEAVDDPGVIAAFSEVTNHGDEGKTVSCLIMRLFRNMPAHRFTGAIHEQVITPILDNSVRHGMRVVDHLLEIDHYGYTEEVRQDKKKDDRNRRHFERALEKEPHNAYLWFKYGDFLRRFGEVEPVIEALGTAVAVVAQMSDAEVSTLTYPAEPHALLALELIKLERVEDARSVMESALERTRHTPMLHWVWGHLNLKLENWQVAYDAFQKCHALDGESVHVPAQPGITSGRSVFGMARALLGMGRKEEALELFETGAARWPDCADLQKALARIRIARRDFRGAIELCMAYLNEDDKDAEFWQIGAEMMLELGLWEQAGVWADRAENGRAPENAGLCAGTAGECAFGRAEFERAADAWSEYQHSPVCAAGLVLLRVILAEPLPPLGAREQAALIHAMDGLLRRLRHAPQAETVLGHLADGLAARAVPVVEVQELLDRHLALTQV